MENIKNKSGRLAIGLMSLALFTAVPGQAAISACGVGTANEAALSTYGSAALGNGCARVDLSFENFAVVSVSNTGGFGTPAPSTTAGYVTGASATSGNTVGVINFLQAAVTPADWTSNNGGSNDHATFAYVATAHSTGTYTGGTYTAPTDPSLSWYFSSLQLLTAAVIPNTVGDSVTFVQKFCLGATTTVGCAAANLATITSAYTVTAGVAGLSSNFSCGSSFSCSGTTANILSSLYFSTVAVLTDMTAIRSSGPPSEGSVTIGDFGTAFGQFADTPEPSTFGMLGAALVGLVFLGRRRKV